MTTGQKSNVGINGGISKGPSDYSHGTRIQIEMDAINEVIEQATGLLFCVRKWSLMTFILLI
ncbi:hypothetical protein VO178_22385 [Lysinibacillus fusiformis]|uniref:hypothetical protein n=1 Tax=Lysinibacillus fusiformis TaxID=28031 RepID=UPI002D76800E|nr:hypothetical protein [Lysinibacillus fusiformis]WRS98054.1 hypothetical protein VO178_22385 [Lysinibacillus fusiformis]